MTEKHFSTHWFLIVPILVGLLLLASPLTSSADLPPRTPPTPVVDHGGGHEDELPVGAYIKMTAVSMPAGAWAVVQWEDTSGGWHDVEAWSGPLDASGYQRWWVAVSDFGTGTFRWIVTQGEGGRELAASGSFTLPNVAHQTVDVEVRPGQ